MATDIATLSIRIEAGDATRSVKQLSSDLSGLTKAQQEVIAKADKLNVSAQSVDIQNKKLVATYLAEVAQTRALAQQLGVLDDVQKRTAQSAQEVAQHQAALAQQTKLLKAEMAGVDVASTSAAGGLGRIRQGLVSLIAQATGTIPVLDRIGATFLTMGVGGAIAIGVVAGLAAIAFAWEHIGAAARKAKKDQDDAIASLREMQAIEDAGPGGKTAIEVTRAVQRQRDLEAQIATQQARVARFAPGSEGRVVAEAVLADMQKEYDDEAKVAQRGVRDVQKVEQQASAEALASRIDFNKKDAAAREGALDLLARDRARYAQLLTLPETISNSQQIAKVAGEIKTLNDALYPKDKSSAREAAQARSLSNIAEQEERRVAAAKALDAAASQGQAAYDRELHSQELKNKLLETEQRIRADFLDKNGKQKAGSDAAMQAEIARAQAAVQAQDELGQHTRATLEIEKDKSVLAVLDAKIAAYQGVGGAIKDAAVEEEYATRVAKARNATTVEQWVAELALAKAIRDRTVALHGAEDANAATKKSAEEALREQERQVRQFERTTSGLLYRFLDNLGKKGKSIWQDIWDSARSGLARFIADMAAAELSAKFASMLGFGGSAITRQITPEAVGAIMAQHGWQLSTGSSGGIADASTVFNPVQSSGLQTAAGYGAIGAGGLATGYGLGGAFYSQSHGAAGNYARGALGGAAAGALTGAAIGSVIPGIGTAIGAAAGGIAGLIGGILGIGSAAKEAAKQTRELRTALAITMDGLRAEVGKDALAASLAQVEAQRETIRKQIEDAYSGGGRNSDTVKERNKQLAELNRLEDERIRQLKEEAAVMQTRQIEDYKVRELRAEGKTKEADALAFREQQQREREDLVRSFGDTIDAKEKEILAAYDAAAAAEAMAFAQNKTTDALNAFGNALHNTPTGFKIEPYTFQYGTPAPRPGISKPPTQPQYTIAPIFNIDGTKTSRDQVKDIAVVLKKIVVETLGSNADVSQGWGLLA